ncbi:MAG: cobalamin biosynthesis protein CobW [Parvularculaceae bacterium]|nr:cobalamin biosynthesis protein CobW [Parvularculaceae bacterium]
MWAKELYGYADHTPETEEYGVTSYVYRARRPFQPDAIHKLLNGEMPGVIRAKGHFWIATRPDWVAEFSLAGALSSVEPMGTWWAAVPRERWPDGEVFDEYIGGHWEDTYGDRRQEIVFIGAGIDWPALTARLDAALVPDDGSYSVHEPAAMPDPFPQWRRGEVAA